MGVGIYIVWPAFYTDITDAYRLGKWGRLRTDIGGMYFNAIFALLVAGLYAVTRFEPLLLLVLLQNFAIIQQALPLLRLDGYYILSDLTGVPDIFLRIRAVLLSLIPGRPADDRVKELKSWVRAVVSAYVLFIVLFLGVTVVGLVINLPRIASTGYDSAALRLQAVGPAFSHGKTERGVLDVIQMLFLVLPTAGLAFTAARVGRRAGSGTLRWSSGHAGRQVALGLAGAGAIALAAFSWWPNGQYRPVQAGERGTLTGLVREVAALPTGRPSLTVQRERQLGGAPLESQHTSLGSAGGAGHSGQPGQPPAGKPGGQGADHNASNGIASGSGSGAEQTTTTSSGGSSAGQSGSGSPAGGSTTPSSSVGAGGGAGVTTPTDSTSTTTTTSASPGGSSPTSTQ
jgi:hypothetical protein